MAGTCFVIMPISTPPEIVDAYGGDPDHFAHVLDHLFVPALTAGKYNVVRPAFDNSEVIQGEIIGHLAKADLVLCDISAWNANVFFELGIRVALDRPVALVRDNLTAIPFDNSIVSCYTYNSSLALWSIQEEISALTAFVQKAGRQGRNALWKYFGIAQTASVHDAGDPVQAKLDVLLTEIQTLRQFGADNTSGGMASPAKESAAPLTPPRRRDPRGFPQITTTVIKLQAEDVLEQESKVADEVRKELEPLVGMRLNVGAKINTDNTCQISVHGIRPDQEEMMRQALTKYSETRPDILSFNIYCYTSPSD